jgi:hypothetical protein
MKSKRLKHKIKVIKNDKELYFGKPLDLPIRDEFIIKKSVELFDDEDPCIIHQSYVVKEFSDSLVELFLMNETTTIQGKDYINELEFLDYKDLQDLTFELVG